MGITYHVLELAEELAPSTDVAITVIPVDGAEVRLVEFEGNAAFSKDSLVSLVWDYGPSEVIMKSTKGSIDSKLYKILGTGDGIKKVGLILQNADPVNTLILSGSAMLRLKT